MSFIINPFVFNGTFGGAALTYNGALDVYTGYSYGAYSTTIKLRNEYTGYAFEVRRENDNVTSGIGFLSNGFIDSGSLAAFCGGNTGKMTKAYNQGSNGSSKDLIQSSTNSQAIIYNGSGFITGSFGGLMWINDNVDDRYAISRDTSDTGPHTRFSIFEDVSITNGFCRDDGAGVGFGNLQQQKTLVGHHGIYAGVHLQQVLTQRFGLNQSVIHTMVFSGTNSSTQINDFQTVSGNAGTNNPEGIVWGAFFNGNSPAHSRHSTLLVFSGVLKESERNAIKNKLNTQLGLY